MAPDCMRVGMVALPPPETKFIAPGGKAVAKASTFEVQKGEKKHASEPVPYRRLKPLPARKMRDLLVNKWESPPMVGIFMTTTFPINNAGIKVA
jgi:hypothetical protein